MVQKNIQSIEDKQSKSGTPFWSVKFADGGKASIWDEAIALTVKQNLNKPLDLELKTSAAGYTNIRALNMASSEPMTVPSMPDASQLTPNQPQVEQIKIKTDYDREDHITAAWIVKSAVDYVKGVDGDFGQNLCEAINEINGARKYALSLL